MLAERLQDSLGSEYRVEAELGGGGMSRVFLAQDEALGRRVVVKVFSSDVAAGLSVERFRREIMVAANLQHPHIVPVLRAGEADGLPYFIMPFVEGDSLRSKLVTERRLSIRDTVSILKDIARALAYAHEQGIVHRDLKPDNVLLSGGSATLTDFGVAKALASAEARVSGETDMKLTRVGTSLGTPTYMAPEQAAADDAIDHRADIYAFGIVAYEMLAGKPPFEHDSLRELLAAHIAQRAEPLATRRDDVPQPLAQLVERCLEKEPGDRPQTAGSLVDALEDPAVVSGTIASGPVAAAAARRGPGRSRWRLAWIGLSVLTASVAGFVTVMNVAGPSAPVSDPENSIAVLPLVNLSGDTADAYFADGLTDELTTALARVPGLRVASRTAAFGYRNTEATVSEIGEALNVSTLLEGTVRREGSRLRLSAQLIDVEDGLALWSETYQQQMSDVFAVQDSLTRSIVTALTERFGGAVGTAARREAATEDLEAYDRYLRGRFFFQKRGAESLPRALAYFEAAVARDSLFAEAYAGMAEVYGVLPLYTTTPIDSVLPLALAAVNRAIALDSGLAAAYAARGNLLNAAWQWADAERDFRRAIRLDPQNASAHQWYGENLMINGRIDESLEAFGEAARHDPLSPIIAGTRGLALGTAGFADSAEASGLRAVELDPDLPFTRVMLAAVRLYGDDVAGAIDELETVRRAGGVQPIVTGFLGYAYARADRREDALELLAGIDGDQPTPGGAPAIARIHLGLGNHRDALEWLERAAARRDPFFSSETMASPIFDPLRSLPGFARLVERVGLDSRRLVGTRTVAYAPSVVRARAMSGARWPVASALRPPHTVPPARSGHTGG